MKLFQSTSKNRFKNIWPYENIWQITTGQGDDYTTGCLIDYVCFKNYYKIIAIDLSKQQAPDGDSKAMQQSNFTGNLARDGMEIQQCFSLLKNQHKPF